MVILGVVLLTIGALLVLAAIFVSEGSAELLGMDLGVLGVFLVGVAAGAAILWGFGILKYGTKRGLQARKERKEIEQLSEKLDRVDAERDRRSHERDRDPGAN